MPEFICCGPNNSCINAEHIVSMEWAAIYNMHDDRITLPSDFTGWKIKVSLANGKDWYIDAPYTAWFENFIGPMPERPKE